MKGKWIWIAEEKIKTQIEDKSRYIENIRVCFASEFEAAHLGEEIRLEICAVTKYIVYLNGNEIGRGPVRSGRDELYLDSYQITSQVKTGKNYLALRVWDYGWSTYQTVHKEGGLFFFVSQGETTLAASDEKVLCALDTGHKSFTVKRNVNLGFTDYYDAGAFDADWIHEKDVCSEWGYAEERERYRGILKDNILRTFHNEKKRPQQIVRVQEVEKGCQQVSINMRRAFFGDRKDADETIFSGFLGFRFLCPKYMEGLIAFPNRTWNGIIGDFKIDGKCYPVTNEEREIAVQLETGEHLFLMQISGKFDDLYCHMEFCFPEEIQFSRDTDRQFFVIGPTKRIQGVIDGFGKVYGGLDEYDRLEEHTDFHKQVFESNSWEELSKLEPDIIWIEQTYVFFDEYIYSLAKRDRVLSEYAVSKKHLGMLWDNQEVTVLSPAKEGDARRIIVDFKDLYVGSLEFTLYARVGVILDIYCFENMYQGEIDYTIGLNNAMRYICKDGWQTYKSMARMGMRYAMLTIRGAAEDVKILDFHLVHSTYAPSNFGEFECDDFLLNKVWEMCRHTHQLCMEDSFTDCPTYEQAFWIGDAGLSSITNAYVFGEYELIKRNITLAVTAGENTPLLNALTPTDWNTSIPMWTMNFIVSIRDYVQVTGEKELLKELYDKVSETLHYYAGFIQEDGSFLINAWNMMDWAAMDIHNYGVVTGQQALLAYCYGLAEGYARELKKDGDAEFFDVCRTKLLCYINDIMWDKNRQMFLDGYSPEHGMSTTVSIQTHILLSLYEGITDPKKQALIEQYLEEPPEEFVQVGSPFMLYYLYEVWVKKGWIEKVFDNIKLRWGEMIAFDSTTCWEVFPGFYEVNRTRSYCHSWSASPAYFMIRYGLGIESLQPGFKKVVLKEPQWDMKWCRGSLPTPQGPIHIEWILDGRKKECRLRIPQEIELQIPKDFNCKLTILKQKKEETDDYDAVCGRKNRSDIGGASEAQVSASQPYN